MKKLLIFPLMFAGMMFAQKPGQAPPAPPALTTEQQLKLAQLELDYVQVNAAWTKATEERDSLTKEFQELQKAYCPLQGGKQYELKKTDKTWSCAEKIVAPSSPLKK